MTDADRDLLRARGIGITNIVRRATARADELTRQSCGPARSSWRRRSDVRRRAWSRSLGITAYRTAFDAKAAVPGRQPGDLAGVELWVVPNPSGLNAHETVASLAVAYGDVARAAGVI